MTYRLLLTTTLLLLLAAGPVAADGAIRIVSHNLNRLFDDIDNGNREKVETTKRFHQRLKSVAQVIRHQFLDAHIIALQEVENINVLEKLADQVIRQGGSDYQAILETGNDVSGINVGYLIRKNLAVKYAYQLFKDNRSGYGPLFSRPPLLVKVCLESCINLINLHLRSMRNLRSIKKGRRVSKKRMNQARKLAQWVNQFQIDNPGQSLMLLGDFNALTPSDEFSDILGTIIGNPDNSNVRYPSKDWIVRDLVDLTRQVPVNQRYSYIYKGRKQILDYMLVNQAFEPRVKRIEFVRVRRSISDHSGLLAEFNW